jgi:transcriptional regulator with XRE-family HTH domain
MANNRIKQLRLEHGMSLKELADKVGVTDSHLSRAENGKRGLQVKKVEQIARIFKVPVAELMNLETCASLPDVAPYTPPRGSVLEKAFTSTTQRMFKVLTNCMSELAITEGDPIIVDTSPLAKTDLHMGDLVVAEVGGGEAGAGILVLRQFLEPNLLVTNSVDNNVMPIHIIKARAKIIGRVLR